MNLRQSRSGLPVLGTAAQMDELAKDRNVTNQDLHHLPEPERCQQRLESELIAGHQAIVGRSRAVNNVSMETFSDLRAQLQAHCISGKCKQRVTVNGQHYRHPSRVDGFKSDQCDTQPNLLIHILENEKSKSRLVVFNQCQRLRNYTLFVINFN